MERDWLEAHLNKLVVVVSSEDEATNVSRDNLKVVIKDACTSRYANALSFSFTLTLWRHASHAAAHMHGH
jgi:hypothetical protein